MFSMAHRGSETLVVTPHSKKTVAMKLPTFITGVVIILDNIILL